MLKYSLRSLLFLLLATASEAQAQGSAAHTVTVPNRLPPTPTTVALERYALMPVSEPTGTPTIAIPLYEVHSGQLTLPLSISYHASGIRVTDVASWVGLGWSLNAGGMISRIVRGAPDDNSGGWRYHYRLNQVPQENTLDEFANSALLDRIGQGLEDYQPDLYTFNFAGQTGTFQLGNDGAFHIQPRQPLHIAAPLAAPLDTGFVVTDAHGISYAFSSKERLVQRPKTLTSKHYISAWYLDRIVSADRADTIRFEYIRHGFNTYPVQQQQTITASISIAGAVTPAPEAYTEADSWTTQSALKLQRIVFKTGSVKFQSDGARVDITGERRLTQLTVLARNHVDTLKAVRFYYSYFEREPVFNSAAADLKSLRLDSVQTKSAGLVLPPYRFSYNTTVALPDARFGSRDHWGYYNGANPVASLNGTALLIPRMRIQTLYGLQTYPGADRQPHPDYVQAGLLTKIKYPTGGQQQFFFEPNTLPQRYELPRPEVSRMKNVMAPPLGNRNRVTADTTFTITGTVSYAHCEGHLSTSTPVSGHENDPYHTNAEIQFLDITASTTNPIVLLAYATAQATTDSIPLEDGHTYRMVVTAQGLGNASLTVSYKVGAVGYGLHNVPTGGVRLREERMQAAPQAPSTSKYYFYNAPHASLSSGYSLSQYDPTYQYIQRQVDTYIPPGSTPNDATSSLVITEQNVLTSSSLEELSGGGQVVGYTCVTMVDSASAGESSGRIVSTYNRAPDIGGGWRPPIPAGDNSWRRGQLVTQRTYARDARGLHLLTKQENDYATVVDTTRIIGFSASPNTTVGVQTDVMRMLSQLGLRAHIWANTVQLDGWQYLRQARTYRYASLDSSAFQLTTTTYQYANSLHQQPTLVETDLGGGRRQQVRARYVADYDTTQVGSGASAAAQALRELWRTHAVADVVEQTTTRTTATDTVVVSSHLTLSRIVAPRVVVPAQQWSLETPVPQPWRMFRPTRLLNNALQADTHYTPQVIFDRYNAQRQLVQAHVVGGLPTSYLWDAYAGQPLAKATAAVQQIAFTSFEPQATGRWAYDAHLGANQQLVAGQGHQGGWAYRLGPTFGVARDSIPAGEYVLAYWQQGTDPALVDVQLGTQVGSVQTLVMAPGGWRQQQLRLRFTGTGTVRLRSGGAAWLLDDLSLQPVGAHLTSYTYDPLRGMTSQTDATGRALRYDYDGLGRLVRTRDEQGRILSQQQYHYAGH